ncbi:class II histocompatibility antigen, B-L beta chain-like [Aphelocoma coerulescens]|uniref:class II histocompatibility antigen, B-L beta chain-like n=1 Tax=Aphelocoma coerulescens TaxID=39617 RepID=UPI00360443D9
MGRVVAAGAVLVALVVLGAPPTAGVELSGHRAGAEEHLTAGAATALASDVGLFVGDSPCGEKQAQCWNSHPARLGYKRALADRLCRHHRDIVAPLLAARRGAERRAERVPSGPALGMSLEPLSPPGAHPRGLLSFQGVLMALWGLFGEVLTPVDPRQMPADTARSKILTGIGDFVLGFIFLALGLGFHFLEKVCSIPGEKPTGTSLMTTTG